jgi:predicted solute-binding protein
MLIRLGHSPDPDDAFMFWALHADAVDSHGFTFETVQEDIQTLNEWALEGRLDVTAISLATYPLVQDEYLLLPHGSSMGSGYGPVVVSLRPLSLEELRRKSWSPAVTPPRSSSWAWRSMRPSSGVRSRSIRSSTRSSPGGRKPGS